MSAATISQTASHSDRRANRSRRRHLRSPTTKLRFQAASRRRCRAPKSCETAARGASPSSRRGPAALPPVRAREPRPAVSGRGVPLAATCKPPTSQAAPPCVAKSSAPAAVTAGVSAFSRGAVEVSAGASSEIRRYRIRTADLQRNLKAAAARSRATPRTTRRPPPPSAASRRPPPALAAVRSGLRSLGRER